MLAKFVCGCFERTKPVDMYQARASHCKGYVKQCYSNIIRTMSVKAKLRDAKIASHHSDHHWASRGGWRRPSCCHRYWQSSSLYRPAADLADLKLGKAFCCLACHMDYKHPVTDSKLNASLALSVQSRQTVGWPCSKTTLPKWHCFSTPFAWDV